MSDDPVEMKEAFVAPHLDTDIEEIEEVCKYKDFSGSEQECKIIFKPNDCEMASRNLATLVQPITGIYVADKEKVRSMINNMLGEENKCCFGISVEPRCDLRFTDCEATIGKMITEFLEVLHESKS